jgi:hypothetical protein
LRNEIWHTYIRFSSLQTSNDGEGLEASIEPHVEDNFIDILAKHLGVGGLVIEPS